MSYTPRFWMFFSVQMGYPPLGIYAFVPLIVTMYTVLDPMAIIFFIHEYRRAVVKMIKGPILENRITKVSDLSKLQAQTIEIRSKSYAY
ncbi:hypothetical protein ANCCAN_02937 [Ancylostoma caninum]|uniref:7TM GPCR serpentine receptor class x (Srx) domain-containing protein n=1 Tax=Ancylostoma caninum TaxID=29170 RepID=A0A368H2U1_ANCCA|nr:hypothetical protein ANCCAN_02937 [Ancylostoma caninum]